MALHEKNDSRGNFFQLKHGGFTLEADGPTEGFTETEVPNPSTGHTVTKYLKTYAAIDGKITKIQWYDREHDGVRYVGVKLIIHDGGETYSLDLPFGKRHYNYFMRVMDNIDYTQPVSLESWPKKDDKGRSYTEFAIKQNGQFVAQSYTRANPGECPLAVEIKDGLGTKWDSRDRQIWLRDRLLNHVIPHVDELNATGDAPTDDADDAFTGPSVTDTKVKAAKVHGTPPEDEAEFAKSRRFVDTVPEEDDIPF